MTDENVPVASGAGPEESRARVFIAPGREKPLLDGHPWVFSGSVVREEGSREAALADILTADGRPLATGFYSAASRIRVRRLGAPGLVVDQEFFRSRLETAARWRAAILPERTTGYRLLNAEGDGVPGWTVDRFGDLLVSQITVAGLERKRDEAYAALAGLWPESAILHAGDLAARKEEKLPRRNETIVGVDGDVGAEAEFEESGLRFIAEIAGGQKTGFYCDQRENRRRAERLAPDRRVLDLFAHSGAFSLYCLRGGATSVTMVDSAARLGELARRGVLANGLDAARTSFVVGDVFEELRRRQLADSAERFDLIVCDPPPLARRKEHVEPAARAYKDLNRLALGRLAPGGFLLTFSCSGAIDAKLFRQILFAAAVEANVDLALLEPLAAAADHPVSVFHPQGEYLKGWLAVSRGPLR